MIIKEANKSWSAEFVLQGMPELTEEELKALKNIIRSAGEVITALTSLPEELSPEARETIIGVMGFVMLEAKNNALLSVDNILGNEAMRAPLENEFSPVSIFGLDIKEALIASLTPDEIKLAAEHYSELIEEENEDPPEET